MVGPWLRVHRIEVHRCVHGPMFLAGDLENEHIVDVVVGIESPIAGRGHIGVGLHRMTEIVDEATDEVDDRGPQPV